MGGIFPQSYFEALEHFARGFFHRGRIPTILFSMTYISSMSGGEVFGCCTSNNNPVKDFPCVGCLVTESATGAESTVVGEAGAESTVEPWHHDGPAGLLPMCGSQSERTGEGVQLLGHVCTRRGLPCVAARGSHQRGTSDNPFEDFCCHQRGATSTDKVRSLKQSERCEASVPRASGGEENFLENNCSQGTGLPRIFFLIFRLLK